MPNLPKIPVIDPLPAIIPGGRVSLLAGASQTGKTALMASILAALRKGEPVFGIQPNPLPFIGVVASDRLSDSHEHWFNLAGIADIALYSLQDDLGFDLERFQKKQNGPNILEHCMNELDRHCLDYTTLGSQMPRSSLVVVDTLALFVGGDMNNYYSVAVALLKINRMCKRRGITVVGIMHTAKQLSDTKQRYLRPQDRILGSTALGGYTETQMYLMAPEEHGESWFEFGWIPHTAPAAQFKLKRAHNGLFVPYSEPGKKGSGRMNELRMLIPSVLPGIHTTELIALAESTLQIKQTQTYEYLKKLRAAGLVVDGGAPGFVRRVAGTATVAAGGGESPDE